jgi:hypothetical protein
MSQKFIPNRDCDFATMATSFANTIARDPQKWGFDQSDADELSQRVQEFRDAFSRTVNPATRTSSAAHTKDEKRKRAEEIIRRLANIVRASDQISAAEKTLLKIKERPKKLGKRTVPFAAPVLTYQGAPHKAGANSGVHQIAFKDGFALINKAKPNGAVRVELFVDLVMPGEKVPQFPGQYLGGRPWYLRSFTSSPMKVKHPVPPVPMTVVYWARWADAKGNVGPFSQTCVTHVEGWTGAGAIGGPDKLLGPMPDVKQLASDPKYITTITQLRQIEQVRVERLLPDTAEGAAVRRELEGPTTEATAQTPQLPKLDAA